MATEEVTSVFSQESKMGEKSAEKNLEAIKLALDMMAQGKRNVICGEIPVAVNQFQEACAMLAKEHGEMATECAEAYLCYGQSLLDLARMETGVLGNALQGVDVEEEAEVKESDQFEKADTLAEDEREKLRMDVYDAMSQEDKERTKSAANGEAKENGHSESKTEETGKEKSENKDVANSENGDKSDKVLVEKCDNIEKKETETKTEKEENNEADVEKMDTEISKSESKENGNSVSDQTENKESKGSQATADTKDAETQKDGAAKKDAESQKNGNENGMETESGESSKSQGESKEDGVDKGEGDADKEEEDEGGEEEGEEEEEGDEAEEGSDTKEEEEADDVPNLQLAWEMLELSKMIYLKDPSKDSQLKAAQAYLKLGEVSLETEQYEQATEDFKACLKLQKTHLEPADRLLAETHYQLGLSLGFDKKYDESIEHYKAAIKVIEEKIVLLEKVIEENSSAKGKELSTPDDPVTKSRKEIEELREILPDIASKIEDAEEENKNLEQLKTMTKEIVQGTLSAMTEAPSEAKPIEVKQASDISHLIRKKRKPDDDADEQEPKKIRQEEGAGDAPVIKQNGHDKSTEEKTAEPMTT